MTKLPLEAAFDVRTAYLYRHMVTRFAEKRYKTGKRKGQLLRPAIPIDFSLADFRAFVLKLLGNKNGSVLCFYCNGEALDAMNIGLDHHWPVSQGGSASLINLKPCCQSCQKFKGPLSPIGFAWLKHQLVYQVGKALTVADSKDIMMRLKSGGGFFRTKKKAKDTAAKLQAQEAQELF